MTNQPTDNEWIEKVIKQYYGDDYDCAEDFGYNLRKAILSNLPKPTEVVAPVDIEIILKEVADMQLKNPLLSRYEILRIVLPQHLKGTTPVEPINQERLREIIENIQKLLRSYDKDFDGLFTSSEFNDCIDDKSRMAETLSYMHLGIKTIIKDIQSLQSGDECKHEKGTDYGCECGKSWEKIASEQACKHCGKCPHEMETKCTEECCGILKE